MGIISNSMASTLTTLQAILGVSTTISILTVTKTIMAYCFKDCPR
ncbi:hypothetical protein DKAM_0895 [Desulfurococcus amylolyticus 1221n]|uniref:Uncharacterized protein n=1 Tax=Desulfurococcus amylolyticus (strain DSM 18924 / JCM 16383 / VKM B-2413 / 1221n) TaxID=490899 RepID=B8D540_DESA1|nr:hypothetical protein DKAM_0895 [Desulfurococcus amylolyticus 1221n]